MASSSNVTSRDSISEKQRSEATAVEEETLDDLISQLPDALLVQILSLLPTKDAVKSCVLSKRWPYLWNYIHNFYFVDGNFHRVRNFGSFVDHVLTHSTCSKINKFQLDIHNTNCDYASKISEWLSFVVAKKVEHVVLDAFPLADVHYYELPLSMYTCSSLITLHLSFWVFDKGMAIAWNSLKSLTLSSTELEDDDFVLLLSSCPALETMKLVSCVGCHRLEITSPNLKRLTLESHSHPPFEGYGSLEIFAPYLQHLDISGTLSELKCRLVNVSSLVTASLTFTMCGIIDGWDVDDIEEDSCRDYHQVFRNLVLDYLEKLSYVSELVIGTWLVEFSNPPCQLEQSYFDEVDNINLPSWIPNTVFPNLRSVKIVGYITECLKEWSKGSFCRLFELSKFLLKNAVVLQKLVIVAKRRKCCTCSEYCVSRYLSQLTKKLLDSPRSSTNVVIIYQELS